MSFPLFIVGMPRSGTKLLRGMLNRHGSVAIPLNETEFLPAWIRKWASFGDLAKRENFLAFYNQFVDTFYFQHRLAEHGQLITPDVWYHRCNGDFSIASVFENLIRHDAACPEEGIWGDKSPSYVRHIAEIRSIYPNAKFIHLVRDARDYVLSLEEAFGKNRLRAAQRWNDSILQAQREGQSLGEDFCCVRYEDLVDHPEQEARRLCQFLGLEFEERMVQLEQATENIGSTKGQVEIVSGNYGKYKSQLSASEISLVESYCAEALREMGYSVQHVGVNLRLSDLEMRRHQVGDAFRLVQREARETGWTSALRRRIGHFVKVMW